MHRGRSRYARLRAWYSTNANSTAKPDCIRGDPNGDAPTAYTGSATRVVTFAIECDTEPVGATCPGRSTPQAWVAIYSSVALVDDPAPPVVEPLSGALVSPGWHEGVEQVRRRRELTRVG